MYILSLAGLIWTWSHFHGSFINVFCVCFGRFSITKFKAIGLLDCEIVWDKCITSSKLFIFSSVLAHLGYNQFDNVLGKPGRSPLPNESIIVPDANNFQAHSKPQPAQQNANEEVNKARIGHGLFGQAKVNVDNMFVCRLLCQF